MPLHWVFEFFICYLKKKLFFRISEGETFSFYFGGRGGRVGSESFLFCQIYFMLKEKKDQMNSLKSVWSQWTAYLNSFSFNCSFMSRQTTALFRNNFQSGSGVVLGRDWVYFIRILKHFPNSKQTSNNCSGSWRRLQSNFSEILGQFVEFSARAVPKQFRRILGRCLAISDINIFLELFSWGISVQFLDNFNAVWDRL